MPFGRAPPLVVSPYHDGWAVFDGYADDPMLLEEFARKAQAETYARERLKGNNHAGLVVENRDGEFQRSQVNCDFFRERLDRPQDWAEAEK